MLKELNIMAVLPASDMSRATDFYTNVLGLDSPEPMNEENLLFHSGDGTSFLVYKTDNAGSARNTQMGWTTGDIDADVAALRNRGVVFEEYDFPEMKTDDGIAVMPVGRAAWFRDSEGNILNLFQRG